MPGLAKRRRFVPLAVLSVAALVGLAALQPPAQAQGLVQGVEQGARAGNKAAGPVGGVLGGAIGGVVGVVGGVLTGVTGGNTARGPVGAAREQTAPPRSAKEARKQEREAKRKAKSGTAAPVVQLTAEQMVANSDAHIERIKRELSLTPEQEKHWGLFSSAMHYLGQHGAERLTLRKARAQRDPPDDIVEQMRNEAQFLYDRGADQRAVADAAEPLYASLDDKQKAFFVAEMVRLSTERGLD
ncbi:Spy/CpxP family protein refolding chaperone [Rhodopseudomonas pseudopalustris]|uniref:LTXXQ motif family protein n=1 Tax=Rhodopseudomonas pseudopalustris TaxID=1513892 RepID=A0A1H8VL49_9BRAD|nr:Spy/CpxP family protein refolding chaperone [Rhodopseudomonas pseudopalustris]SEP16109.1 LTXXQ motif family protein [Rhodopseudomonas pseudopalustris]